MTITYSDFRSDTVTRPTDKMRRAMADAVVGDDVLGDDPTVLELERRAAETMGKEAALFCPSGTMANSIAVKMWTNALEEVIVEERSHIYNMESTHMTFISGVTPRPVRSVRGAMDPQDVAAAIRKPNVHTPQTTLICLENTHNNWGGAVIPLENFKAIRKVANENGLKVHLDGARIFNAAVALGVDARELTRGCDSVNVCLSKGLAAPVGSVICGSRDFIARARRTRKMLGGGMRQAGIIAAAGIVALETMIDRLAEDHANARRLAEGIAAIEGLATEPACVRTNILYCDLAGGRFSDAEFQERLAKRGLRIHHTGPARFRMLTHYGIAAADIDAALAILRDVMQG
jgi:threonine aldolase